MGFEKSLYSTKNLPLKQNSNNDINDILHTTKLTSKEIGKFLLVPYYQNL